jgi:cytochrome c-type biogenesis protein CcmF
MAGIWKKDYSGWTRAALPWTLFAACVLGTGVMMGAAWAYEALSFGGFWSWDPVENASFVPWLVLVAGLHTQLAYRSTGHSLRATYFFLITSFVLVLYATFLTRSGILGDASVHAFVDSGMNLQLVLFILIFMIPGYVLFIKHYSKIPHIEKEERGYSREFWMFIGSLVLFLSSLFIITATSLPVLNKAFGTKWSVGEDNTFAYNRIEIFIAMLLGVLTAITQYLKYKDTDKKIFFRHLAIPTAVGMVVSILVSAFGNIHFDRYGTGYLVAIHIGIFAMYIWTGMNGKIQAAGASIAHFGFGIMLIGILLSTSKKELLSYNTTGINLPFDPKNKDKDPLENITLLKNVRTDMGHYWATFTGEDSTNETGNINYYHIRLQDKRSGELFELYPNLIKATKGMEGVSQNPDKHHYWDRDIFSYIQYASNLEKQSDTSQFRYFPISEKDTVFYSNGYLMLDKTVRDPDNDKYHFTSADTALMADVLIVSRDSTKYHARPLIYVKDDRLFTVPDTVFTQNLIVVLKGVEEGKPQIGIRESSSILPFVSLKAYVFPQINLLWLGTLVMIFGFVMSIIWRVRTSRI